MTARRQGKRGSSSPKAKAATSRRQVAAKARRRRPPRGVPDHDVERWIDRVLAGDVLVGRLVRLACERHRRDLKAARSRGLRFDVASADRVLAFFPYLRHWKGEFAGRPIELEPWQRFLLYVVFGWLKADGTRRFRIAYVEVARKNGKTTLAGGVALYLAFADGEPGAEVYAAATKKDQARIVFEDAKRMRAASPELRERVKAFQRNLSREEFGQKIEPLSSEENTLDGLNTHGAIIDELHAHRTAEVWNVIDTSTGSRRQPLIFAITTAGNDRSTICWDQHERALQVLEGTITDDEFFAFVAALDEGDDWRDAAVWGKANPNLGVSVKRDQLEAQIREAERSPARQNQIRQKRLNEWVQGVSRFLDLGAWDACAGRLMPAELERHLEGRRCWAGLDLGSVSDLTAAAFVFPPEDAVAGVFDVLVRFWMPEERVEARVRGDHVPYDAWIRDGWIVPTPGNARDDDSVFRDLAALADRFRLVELAHDRWQAVTLVSRLLDAGIACVQFGQGFRSMSAPTKELEKLTLGRRLRHGGHPVLRWNADNVVVERDAADNLKPAKHKSRERIDGIVALIMGLDGAMRLRDDATPPSVYETRGVLRV